MSFTVIILAAGKGTRMKSSTPKVMHKVAGRPMLEYLIGTATDLKSEDIRVVSSDELMQADGIKELEAKYPAVSFIKQKDRLGTSHAVKCAIDHKEVAEKVIVLYADSPLISYESICNMVDEYENNEDAQIVNLGFYAQDPTGYGRFITQYDNELFDIIEEKEATEEQKEINLCNSGIILAKGSLLGGLIESIDNNNAVGEYYLTDIVKIANSQGVSCCYTLAEEYEVLGVNTRVQLAEVENIMQCILKEKAMLDGVTIIDPDTVYLSIDTEFAEDITIHPNVVIGEGVKIDEGVEILPFSHIAGAIIESNAVVGPFARLRPETNIGSDSKIGNFVELKKANIGSGTKISHLSYVGDASIGEGSNIGAGTIFCNYDGKKKHHSNIGKNAFIGSNSCIISPVNVGDNVLVGAGSVITDDVEEGDLAIARSKQVNKKRK